MLRPRAAQLNTVLDLIVLHNPQWRPHRPPSTPRSPRTTAPFRFPCDTQTSASENIPTERGRAQPTNRDCWFLGIHRHGPAAPKKRGSVLFIPAGHQTPDVQEILEDHLVEPSELTSSDRPVEISTAGAEKGLYWDISARNDHVPGLSLLFLLSPLLHPLDSSFFILSRRSLQPK